MRLRAIVPTLPMWIMFATLAFLVTIPATQVGESDKGPITLSRCGWIGVERGLCSEDQQRLLAIAIVAMILIALLILPVLYFWNRLLVRVGIGDDW